MDEMSRISIVCYTYNYLQLLLGVALTFTDSCQLQLLRLQRLNVDLVTHRGQRHRVPIQLL